MAYSVIVNCVYAALHCLSTAMHLCSIQFESIHAMSIRLDAGTANEQRSALTDV